MTGLAVPAALLAGIAAFLFFPGQVLVHSRPQHRPRGDGRALPLLGIAGVMVLGYFTLGGLLGVVAGAGGGAFGWRLLRRLESRGDKQRREALQRAAPLLAELVAGALAAGRDPASALRMAAESAGPLIEEELAVYSASLALGAEPISVWRALGDHPQFGGVGRAFVRAVETGSSVSAAMSRGAEDLRRLDRSTREAAARSVSTRVAAPLGAVLLPAFVVVGVVPVVAGAVQQFFS